MGAQMGGTDDDLSDHVLFANDSLSTTPTPSSSPRHDELLTVSPMNALHAGVSSMLLDGDDDDDGDDEFQVHRAPPTYGPSNASSSYYTPVSMRSPDDHDNDDNEADMTAADSMQAHRQGLSSALAQLPRVQPEADDTDSFSSGLDQFYASPGSSPVVTGGYSERAASSTALILAPSASATSPTSSPSARSMALSARQRRVRAPYTGLSNQGATCYMNSLLQTMFMTPELRLGLYRWQPETEGEDVDDEDNIPFQLQQLFAKLQLTSEDSISTKALTRSFGWTGADVFQQHDVQELCRVLFDALEHSFKGTVNETLVNDLYQGKMKDYVQCRTCGYESSRQDEFLDLSLVIRPFGSTTMMQSVEEAIEYFLKPEVLNGDNQWNCERCQTKRDAIKGLKFAKLPYLLSLQLKRFDYDYMTDSRIKLHERVAFPKYLDMNSYVHDEESGGARGTIARKMSMERHELEGRSNWSGSGVGSSPALSAMAARSRRMSSMDETQALTFEGSDEDTLTGGMSGGRGILASGGLESDEDPDDTWSSSFDPEALIARTGPYVYELYSVLIHSGSALGGHYYAYTKSLESGDWFDFNDSNVSAISETEVKKAFGGNGGGSNAYGGRMSYSTCAYMLMYRLVSKNNINSIPRDAIPSSLMERMQQDEERVRRQELERLELAKKILLKFYMKTNRRNKIERSVYVYKTATLREACAIAHATFATVLGPEMPSLANTRLRHYNDYTGLLSDAYGGREDLAIQKLQLYSGCQLFLEVKRDDEEWEDYVSSKRLFYVRRFELPPSPEEPRDSENTVASTTTSDNGPDLTARYLQIDGDATVFSLLELLPRKFDITPGKQIRLMKKTGTSYTSSTPVKILNKDDSAKSLQQRLCNDLHLVNGNEIFYEECDALTDPSPAEAYFEREMNMITLNVHQVEAPSLSVRIDRRETMLTLKEMISARIGIPMDKFKLLRGSNRSNIEIKTLETPLCKLSISHGHSVFALPGTPLSTGEYLFRLMLLKPTPTVLPGKKKVISSAITMTTSTCEPGYEPPLTVTVNNTRTSGGSSTAEADCDSDEEPFDLDELQIRTNQDESELEFVQSIKVGENMPVGQIRELVWQTLRDKGYFSSGVTENDSAATAAAETENADHAGRNLCVPTPAHVRLRSLQTTTMTRILVDGCTLKEASQSPVYEGRGIVAQLLPAPESHEPGHRVVHVVYLDRSTWRFSTRRRFELIVPPSVPIRTNRSSFTSGFDIDSDDDDVPAAVAGGSCSTPVIAELIASRLNIPPEQVRFAVFSMERDTYDICELYKTDFDTWEHSVNALRDPRDHYSLLVFAVDVDVPMAEFAARERMQIQDFLVAKRDEASRFLNEPASSYYSGSSYRKPKETALVIRTKSKSSDKDTKGGSTASSTGRSASGNSTTNGNGAGDTGISIRTPTRHDHTRPSATSDTDVDEEDAVEMADVDLYG